MSHRARPATVTFLALLFILLAAYIAVQPFLTPAGRFRTPPGRTVTVVGYEIASVFCPLLVLIFLVTGFGLMSRSGGWARRTATWLAIAWLVFELAGSAISVWRGVTEGTHAILVFLWLVRMGLAGCAFGLVYSVLDAPAFRGWYAGSEAAHSDTGTAAPEIPSEPLSPMARGGITMGLGCLIGLAVGLGAVYLVVRAILESFRNFSL